MLLPIVEIPQSIKEGLSPYRNLFPRSETYKHIMEYCTGLVVLEKPSINRLSQCLVNGPAQSSINKTLTCSPWSIEEVNQKRLSLIKEHHHNGFTVGVIDTTFKHHPRGQNIYGVYKYWDYVTRCYTYAIKLITSAIVTNDRTDSFDYKIYHRSFESQELDYLNHTILYSEEKDKSRWIKRLIELLSYYENRKNEFKTAPEFGSILINQMEMSEIKPDGYCVDSALFSPTVIDSINSCGKPWVADSEKNRVLRYKGEKFNCETFAETRSWDAFRKLKIVKNGKEKKFWVFTCVVRIRKYGKVRMAVIYNNPERRGNPIYCFTNKLNWNAEKILSTRCQRWSIEELHEQTKQFLGLEDSQLQNEEGVKKHLTLVFLVNSLLKSLDLNKAIGNMSMDTDNSNERITFGQRCRRITLEVFYDLIQNIHRHLEEKKMSVNQVFETLFKRLKTV